jgi:hypothetical protein
VVRSQPRQIVPQDLILKKTITRKCWWNGSKCKPWVQTAVLQKKTHKVYLWFLFGGGLLYMNSYTIFKWNLYLLFQYLFLSFLFSCLSVLAWIIVWWTEMTIKSILVLFLILERLHLKPHGFAVWFLCMCVLWYWRLNPGLYAYCINALLLSNTPSPGFTIEIDFLL